MDNEECDEIYLRFIMGRYNPSAEVVGWLMVDFEGRELYERCKRLLKYSERCVRLKKYKDKLPTDEWEFEIIIDD